MALSPFSRSHDLGTKVILICFGFAVLDGGFNIDIPLPIVEPVLWVVRNHQKHKREDSGLSDLLQGRCVLFGRCKMPKQSGRVMADVVRPRNASRIDR